ncbi:unnamed protein product [Peniophora sp. CBMAI 1063]|nr:unnamed protein product [Peniophora sp. CBMAI 1063]
MASSSSKKSSNSLTISLTENTVFLRGVDFTGRRRNHDNETPAIIRGLLTLELSKPTRISSIEVELQGKTSTSLPDSGVGPRRTEIIEEHKVYCASQVFFRATAPSTAELQRRALSVDPGLHLYRDEDRAPDYADSVPSSATTAEPARGRARIRRQQSADFSIHQAEFERHEQVQRPPLHHHDSSESSFPTSTPDLTPPASPRIVGEPYAIHSLASGGGTYEYEARSWSRPASRTPSRTPSRAPSPSRSRVRPMMPISGSSSLNHVPSDGQPSTSTSARVSFDEETNPHPTFEPRSRSRSQIPDNHLHSHSIPPPHTPPHDGTESPRDRGRHSARFSLANTILDAVKERVRSNSPIIERGRSHQKGRDVSSPGGKGKEKETPLEALFPHLHLPSAIKHSPLVTADEDDEDRKEFGNGWREFKKGTYTFPISFSVPPNMPPTLACFYGTVNWRLKATVHRPGVLTQKMSATSDVTLVAAPSEDDTEDTENIVVERFWDDQMQYVFTISGRMFTIGNTVPIDMTFLPMSKMKIHRLSVYLEEKVDYYVHQHRMSRSDAPSRLVLLALKHEKDEPILPLSTDDPTSLTHSPLAPLLPTDPYAASEAAANLMGPGPWRLTTEARIPKNAHPTNKNKKANMVVGHTLKIVMRVERGDNSAIDPKTGKQKLFEIVVQTPVYVLSHLADTKFTALPRYSESFDRDGPGPSTRRVHPAPLPMPPSSAAPASATTTEGGASGQTTPPALGAADPAVYNRYERLITGQESEMGEAPPAYSEAPQHRNHSV